MLNFSELFLLFPVCLPFLSCTELFTSAFIAYATGTTVAGGSAIIFLLLLTGFLSVSAIPIIIGFVGTFAGVYRTFVFRREIYWPVLKWLLPGTFSGAVIGASVFSLLVNQSGERLLELLLALLLIVTGSIGLFQKSSRQTTIPIQVFLPVGFIIAIISGMLGGAPPLVNSLYQRFPLSPKQVVGTKSVNLLVLQLTKSVVYAIFIGLHYSGKISVVPGVSSLGGLVFFAFIASIGAALGISLGKHSLNKLNAKVFTVLVNTMLLLFGFYFLFLWMQ